MSGISISDTYRKYTSRLQKAISETDAQYPQYIKSLNHFTLRFRHVTSLSLILQTKWPTTNLSAWNSHILLRHNTSLITQPTSLYR